MCTSSDADKVLISSVKLDNRGTKTDSCMRFSILPKGVVSYGPFTIWSGAFFWLSVCASSPPVNQCMDWISLITRLLILYYDSDTNLRFVYALSR